MSSSISSILVGIFSTNTTAQTSPVSNDASTSDVTQQVAQSNQSSGYGEAVFIDLSPQALASLNGTGGQSDSTGSSSTTSSAQSLGSELSNLLADMSSIFNSLASGTSGSSDTASGSTANSTTGSSGSTAFEQLLANLIGDVTGGSSSDSTASDPTTQANAQTASNTQDASPHHHHHHGGGSENIQALLEIGITSSSSTDQSSGSGTAGISTTGTVAPAAT